MSDTSVRTRHLVAFDVYQLDLRSGELSKHGTRINLQQQPQQLLAVLLERPGEVVSRDELRRRLWPDDTFVDFEHGLNAAVKRLRDTLGDSAEAPRFVETIPRRGYRFIAPVVDPTSVAATTIEHAAPLPNVPAATRATLRIAALVIVVAGLLAVAAAMVLRSNPFSRDVIDSVAVLPFVNATGDPDSEYLSDGITESVINNLSQLRTLRVSARSTVFRYKGKDADPQKIGQELRVRAVLSGRLLHRGDTFIVSTELMDVERGAQLWGNQYARKTTDLFVLQEDLSREISDLLRVRLTPEERLRLTKRYTENAEAYRLYLQGRYHEHKLNVEGSFKAIEYYQQATRLDPSYALAYAGLADAYGGLSFFNVLPPREAMPKAEAAARRALQIDDGLADAHISLAWANFTYDWDWPAATNHAERAQAVNPVALEQNALYPFYLTVARRPNEAIRIARRAVDLDPASSNSSHILSVQYYLARQFDSAIAECRRTIELDPTFGVAYEVLGGSFAARGQYDQALPYVQKASALNPMNAISRTYLAYVQASMGARSEALGAIDEMNAASKQRYVPALAFAIVYAGLGDKDHAFEWLDKAYQERFNRLAYLRTEPIWDRLRGDPRFDELLRRIGLPN
jgi:TolB-like protein/DNA-binding winged helix-turn-helix (wHTH) protein